jgi:hypothetical protein
MKAKIDRYGYPIGTLYRFMDNKDVRKYIPIHRLVALAFIANPENKPQINHKSGIKTDNSIENLEWATGSENMQHAFDNKLIVSNGGGKRPVSQYDLTGTFIRTFISIDEAARFVGVDGTRVGGCCNKKPKFKTAAGFKWEFATLAQTTQASYQS